MKNKKILAIIPLTMGGFITAPSIASAATGDPIANPDNVTVSLDQKATIKVLDNDNAGAGATWSSVKLKMQDGSWGTAYDDNTFTFKVDSSKNVEFSAIQGFTGKSIPLTYQATNSLGKSVTSTITVDVENVKGPTAVKDYAPVKHGITNIIDVLKNDKKGVPNATLAGVLFKNASGNYVPELTNSEGHYFVTTNAKVGFVANPSFHGVSKIPVTYRAVDLNNNTSDATLTVYTTDDNKSSQTKTTSSKPVTNITSKTTTSNVGAPSTNTSGKVTLGPKVQTDNVSGTNSATDISAALGLVGLLSAGAGVAIAKKRK